MPGNERQPSSPFWFPSTLSTSGFINATRCSGSLPPEQSITNSRLDIPTCTAAKPTPGAAYIVSNMLLTSFERFWSNLVTGSAGVSRTGAGHVTMSNKAIGNPKSKLPELEDQRLLQRSFEVIVIKHLDLVSLPCRRLVAPLVWLGVFTPEECDVYRPKRVALISSVRRSGTQLVF